MRHTKPSVYWGFFAFMTPMTAMTAHFDLFSFCDDPSDCTLYMSRISYIYRYK
jgi:hypothetical protein